jgi:hypothetical protein
VGLGVEICMNFERQSSAGGKGEHYLSENTTSEVDIAIRIHLGFSKALRPLYAGMAQLTNVTNCPVSGYPLVIKSTR